MKEVKKLLDDKTLTDLCAKTQCLHNKKWENIAFYLNNILSLRWPEFNLYSASLDDMISMKQKITEALNMIGKVYTAALDSFHTIWYRTIKKEVLFALWLTLEEIKSITIRETPEWIITKKIWNDTLKSMVERLFKNVKYVDMPGRPWEKWIECVTPSIRDNAQKRLDLIKSILGNNMNFLTDRIFAVISVEEAKEIWLDEEEMKLFGEIIEIQEDNTKTSLGWTALNNWKKILLVKNIIWLEKIESISHNKHPEVTSNEKREEFINKIMKFFYTDIIIPGEKEWRDKGWNFFCPENITLEKLNQLLYSMIAFYKNLCKKIEISDQYSDF